MTGAAGFIGSNLIHRLLDLEQEVVGFDNYSTGLKKNILEIEKRHSGGSFNFIEGDLVDFEKCKEAMIGVDHILNQGALGSVPRSIKNPIDSHNSNVTGFLTMLTAAKESNINSIVYASSSSVYGDHPDLPKVEKNIGNPLSPYAATKFFNEVYADVFSRTYGLSLAGLRYFNVFGRRQNPEGVYAAVIPLWVKSMVCGEEVFINGDGKSSRDFCYIENVIQANILAAINCKKAESHCYNIAVGEQTTLIELQNYLKEFLKSECDITYDKEVIFRDFRPGDVRHSLADISKAQKDFGYSPTHGVREGIIETIKWYVENIT